MSETTDTYNNPGKMRVLRRAKAMTEIKRYGCDVYYDRGMYECPNGEFLSYADSATIVAERDVRIVELESTNRSVTENYLRVTEERNEALYKVIDLQEQVGALAAENVALHKFCKNAAFDADYEAELGMERGGFTDGFNDIKTPSTDATIREIRAQELDEIAGELAALDTVGSTGVIAHLIWQKAARIRAGEVL